MSDDYEELLDDIYKNLPDKVKQSERFEIPKLDYFVEGNRTIVKNFKVMCDKVRRDPAIVMKYFSKELAVPAEMQADRLVLQRKIVGDMLDKKFADFVERFVMCHQCRRPDTHIDDAGRGLHVLVCESCGARRTVKD